jgi:hypothetical protein
MNLGLSKEEIKIIDNIKIGCEELIKLILSDILKFPEKFAKLDSHKKYKYFVRIFVIHEILRIINKNENKSFRPIDIRNQLPENYNDIKYSSLSDIMNSMVKMRFLIHSSGLDIKKHPGHPFTYNSGDNSSIPGNKSYYTISPLLESKSQLLDKPAAQEILHSHLLKSVYFIKLIEKTALNVMASFKEKDSETALNTRRSVKPLQAEINTETHFLEQFQRDCKILDKLDKEESIQRALDWAKKYVATTPPQGYKEIYQLGMISYYMGKSNVS